MEKILVFFRTYKGLRQGDPLSPLLFNFVGDALSEMLNLARRDGHVKGLAYNLIEGGFLICSMQMIQSCCWITMKTILRL
jgi:hypothetical protein